MTAIVAYHGTDCDFEEFRPLSHFGSRLAAEDRCRTRGGRGPFRDGSKIFKVELTINNPLVIDDFGRQHSADDLLRAVQNAGGLTREEREAVIATPGKMGAWKETFFRLMREKGIDALKYNNSGEDQGSQAFVIFDSSQVRVIKVEHKS